MVISLVSLLSFVNNRLLEMLVDPLRKKYPEAFDKYSFLLIYVSLVTGFVLAYLSKVNVFTGFEQVPGDVGVVLTGLLVGGGSQVLADVLNFIQAKKA